MLFTGTFALYIKMVELSIICVGKNKERYFQEAAAEYIKRLSASCRISLTEIPESKLPAEPSDKAIDKGLNEEAEKIEKLLKKDQYIISLCIEGKRFTSKAFADELKSVFISGRSRLAFIIGGSFGLSEDIKRRSDLRLSMSDMTFPHHLARVVLLEQIYRAFTIIEGTKYNK